MLRGSLEEFSLADILRLLSSAKKTGRLEAHTVEGDGRVLVVEGDVVFAQSLKQEPLGQKLVRSGALSEGELQTALGLHAATGERVGAILLRTGAITEEQLAAAVREQIEDAVFDLLRWDAGGFSFDTDERVTMEIPISVSVESLIIEASRRLDELELIKRRIPSRDVVLAVAPAPPDGAREISITPDEWRMLVLIDRMKSVGDIVEAAGLGDFAGLKTLYGLLSSGLVDVVSLGGATTHEAPSAALEPPIERPPQRVVLPNNDAAPTGASPERRPVDPPAVVRELAGIISEDDRGAPTPGPVQPPPPKRRVEDDDEVDKRLIGRFIDGVKGM